MSEPIAEFHASIPPIQSATSIGGDGSCRLKIDVPASDLAEVMKFAGFGREKLLRITVETGEPHDSEAHDEETHS